MGGRNLDWSFWAILITQQQKLRKGFKSAGIMTLIMISVSGNFIVMVSSTRKLWHKQCTMYDIYLLVSFQGIC